MNNLWEKSKIKNLELKNRVVRSATNEHLGSLEGLITEDYIKVYENLAKNDVGLLITSHLALDVNQRADATHICVNDPRNVENLKLLANTVHKYNSKIIAQISYPGHRTSKSICDFAKTPSGLDGTVQMNNQDILDCINSHVHAVEVLQNAGFDGVQLHIAHSYLLSEFLDPFYNKRDDEYGGSIQNRYRIVHDILTKIKKVITSEFIVTAKIDTISKENNPDFIKQQIQICKYLEQDGLDAVEISGTNFKTYNTDVPYYLENALAIKKEISIPVILVGGFRNMNQINNALENGIDFISMCRPFISEEDFVYKLKAGKSSRCITCNKCFQIYKTEHKRCVFSTSTIKQLEINYPKEASN